MNLPANPEPAGACGSFFARGSRKLRATARFQILERNRAWEKCSMEMDGKPRQAIQGSCGASLKSAARKEGWTGVIAGKSRGMPGASFAPVFHSTPRVFPVRDPRPASRASFDQIEAQTQTR